jgi:hypothetical protein
MVLTIRLAIVVLVAAAFTTTFNKDASAVTAEELLRSCEIVIQQSRPVTPNGTWVPTEGQPCWDYFEAVFDLAQLVDPKSCSSLPCKNPTLRICPPEHATRTQHIRVFVNAAHQNPGRLSLLAAGVAVAALRGSQRFKCRKGSLYAGFGPYVVGVPLLRRLEMAVTSCAGANGLANMMLFGTPLEVQSAAAAPLI